MAGAFLSRRAILPISLVLAFGLVALWAPALRVGSSFRYVVWVFGAVALLSVALYVAGR